MISLHVKQVLTAAVADSIREAQLTGGVQMKETKEGRRTLKSHIGQPLRKFVTWLKKKSFRVKNHKTLWFVWNFRICFWRDKALKTRLQSRATEKEVRKKVTPTGRHYHFVRWAVGKSLNRTLGTILTWALTVLWQLHMNLAQLTWCKMLLCTCETWLLKPFKSQKPAMVSNQWLYSAVWCPSYWAENLSELSLVSYGRGSHSKSSQDREISGTGRLQSSYEGATDKVHSVCCQ